MNLAVAACDPEDARHLLEAHHGLMTELFEPHENHFLSLEALKGEDVRFWGAGLDGALVGCAALALREGYGEVKSMFVTEPARGQGVADALLAEVEGAAREAGYRLLRLETGDKLTAARRLYARHGFTERDAFGEYQTCGSASVFMEKTIG